MKTSRNKSRRTTKAPEKKWYLPPSVAAVGMKHGSLLKCDLTYSSIKFGQLLLGFSQKKSVDIYYPNTENCIKKRQDKGLTPSKRHREKLNSVMDELSDLLPLSSDAKSSLDRLSVLKLTISFFQTQNLVKCVGKQKSLQHSSKNDGIKTKFFVEGISLSEVALEAIGGFFIVLTEDGNVYYVSENVKNYLGYTQIRLMHQDFFTHVHPDDLQGLKACFKDAPFPKQDKGMQFIVPVSRQECYCNVKCHAGRLSSHISPFYYKCFRFFGHLKIVKRSERAGNQYGFFALCSPVSRSVNVSRPIKENAEKYTCKMDAAMSNLHVDNKGLKLLAFSEQDLMGKSAYFFFHPDDLSAMTVIHEQLMVDFKASITFRVAKGNGKWQWVRGGAYTIMKNGKIQGMVSNNILVSDEEGVYYKAQNIKEIQEWKAQQKKAILSSQSSAPSSPDNSSWTTDTEKSVESLSFSPPESITGTPNDMTSPVNKSPVNKSGCVLASQELVLQQYQGTPSKAIRVMSTNGDNLGPTVFSTDVVTKIESTDGSHGFADCLPVRDKEVFSTIIRELQSSVIDEGGDSTLPFSSSSSLWKSLDFGAQSHPLLPDFSGQDVIDSAGASIGYTTRRPTIASTYSLANNPAFCFGGGFTRVDEPSFHQESLSFVGKHKDSLDSASFQSGSVKINGKVEDSDGCHLNFKSFESAERLSEESLKDFELLPLGEIESILSSDESSSCPVTPDSASLSTNLPLDPVFMDSQSAFPQSYQHKLDTRFFSTTAGFFPPELNVHRNQGSPSLDVAMASDLGDLTYSHANGNYLASQMQVCNKRQNEDFLEELTENPKFDHQSHRNHTTSVPISTVCFNPAGTVKLTYNPSMQLTTSRM